MTLKNFESRFGPRSRVVQFRQKRKLLHLEGLSESGREYVVGVGGKGESRCTIPSERKNSASCVIALHT